MVRLPLILTGLMGSGKSTIGRALAKELDLAFVDLDGFIEKEQDLTIPEIFLGQGEKSFRELECGYLKDLVEEERYDVIALGGGTLMNQMNLDLCQRGTLIYLKAAPEFLAQRLKDDNSRPLLQNCQSLEELEKKLRELLEQRPQYLEADLQVDVSLKSENDIVEEILSRVGNEDA